MDFVESSRDGEGLNFLSSRLAAGEERLRQAEKISLTSCFYCDSPVYRIESQWSHDPLAYVPCQALKENQMTEGESLDGKVWSSGPNGGMWVNPPGLPLSAVYGDHADVVDRPPHYDLPGGLQAIDVIEYLDLGHGFNLGNALKYLLRAGRKGPDALEDLKKAHWYLSRTIQQLEKLAAESTEG